MRAFFFSGARVGSRLSAMKKNPWKMLLVLFVVFGALWIGLIAGSTFSVFGGREHRKFRFSQHAAILKLELNGVIIDSRKFVKALSKYREEKFIKAIVVEINSPGGVVGPSQEIYEELKRTREDGKPVVVVSNGLMASGAFYAAVAADKIVVQPGTLVGSIGVIMQFTNLQKLYDWARVSRYSITTGKFKDSGAEYRPMRDDERKLFQDMIDDVWRQFIGAVATGRNLKSDLVKQYADGRVFTGLQAKELGFVDELGTISDAYDLAARLANEDPEEIEIFEPPKPGPKWLDLLTAQNEDDEAGYEGKLTKAVDHAMDRVMGSRLVNRPLFLMPGAIE